MEIFCALWRVYLCREPSVVRWRLARSKLEFLSGDELVTEIRILTAQPVSPLVVAFSRGGLPCSIKNHAFTDILYCQAEEAETVPVSKRQPRVIEKRIE